MKIIAHSKIPATVPFVHLGYLAASTTTTKPIPGLLLSGTILLVAGISVSGRWLWQRKRTPEPAAPSSWRAWVGLAILVLSALAVWFAYRFGEKEKRYAYPERLTSMRVQFAAEEISGELRGSRTLTATLPTAEGEYDLFTVLGQPARYKPEYKDGYDMPLKLRVVARDGQVKYAVVSAGPDRIMGTADDVTSAK